MIKQGLYAIPPYRAEHGPVQEMVRQEADRSRTLVIPVETINRELDAKLDRKSVV